LGKSIYADIWTVSDLRSYDLTARLLYKHLPYVTQCHSCDVQEGRGIKRGTVLMCQ